MLHRLGCIYVYIYQRTNTNKRTNTDNNSSKLQKIFANAVKGGTNIIDPKVEHLKKISKRNIQEEPPTLLKKLELLHPAHTQHHRGKLPTRVPSTTKQTTDKDREIEDLRNQI